MKTSLKNREILKLAIPNIVSNVSIPLLSTVDTLLMGHQSMLELGAIGVSSTIFNVIYWNFGFLRMGTTGMTAQAYGRGDQHEISSMLQKSVLLALGISLALLLFMVPLGNLASVLMNVAEDQKDFVLDYFFTRIWAAPATLSLYALFGWFFGMQNARIPLILTLIINLTNIFLSYYLVTYAGMGIRGVALGTLAGQYAGLIIAMLIIVKQYRAFLIVIPYRILMSWKNLSRFLNINKDIFIRTVCLSFAFAFLYSQSALEGPVFLAANVVMMQFLNWMSYGIDGFAYAAESLVGKYYGAGKPLVTRKVIHYIFAWGGGLAVLYAASYWIFGNAIIEWFTDQPEVIAMSGQLMVWAVTMPLVAFACYLWDGIYIGLTASKSMRNTMLVALFIYLATYYGFRPYGIQSLIWLSMFVFLASRGILQTWLFWRKGFEIN